MATRHPQDDSQSSGQASHPLFSDVLKDFFSQELPEELRTGGGAELTDEVRRRGRRRSYAWGWLAVVAAVVLVGLGVWRWQQSEPVAVLDREVVKNSRQNHKHDVYQTHSDFGGEAEQVASARHVDPVVALRPEMDTSHVIGGLTGEIVGHWVWRRVVFGDVAGGTRVVFEWPVAYELRPVTQDRAAAIADVYLPVESAEVVSADVLDDERDRAARVPVEARQPVQRDEAFLGLYVDVPGDLSSEQPFATFGGIRGLEIVEVVAGSPAEAANLTVGEIVLGFNGEPLDGVEQLRTLVENQQLGERVRLDILGAEGYGTTDVAVGARREIVARPDARRWTVSQLAEGNEGDVEIEFSGTGWPVVVGGERGRALLFSGFDVMLRAHDDSSGRELFSERALSGDDGAVRTLLDSPSIRTVLRGLSMAHREQLVAEMREARVPSARRRIQRAL